MTQLTFMHEAKNVTSMRLPPLEVGPIPGSIGHIRHVIRLGSTCEMTLIGETLISPRVKEPTYRLSTGETVIITKRAKINRPNSIDGVLRQFSDGKAKWISHKSIDAFESAVATRGWAAVATEIAESWNNKFSFRAELSKIGEVHSGDEGLRRRSSERFMRSGRIGACINGPRPS